MRGAVRAAGGLPREMELPAVTDGDGLLISQMAEKIRSWFFVLGASLERRSADFADGAD